MKKKQLRFVTLFLALMVSATFLPVDIYCAEDAATIDPSRKGSIIIEYFSNDDKTPVAGAGFIFRRIAVPATDRFEPDGTLNGIIWASLLGTLEINEYTDIKTILKTADEVYVNGDPKNGGKTYSGVTDIEGRLILDGIEQGLYVAEEIGSAKGYLESEPFVFSIPYVAQNLPKVSEQVMISRLHQTGIIRQDQTGSRRDRQDRRTRTNPIRMCMALGILMNYPSMRPLRQLIRL
ncbi:MAG: hypothetical protein J6Y90_03440 [Lachnospiraceae bacterium]|nr:hypothetical protein [Lachnospiraceae bacterium]